MPPEQEVTSAIAGRYRLCSEIGSGGMGTVWHAEDTLLRRDVAVKEIALPRSVGAEEREAVRKRVLREARAAAALNHANAVTVFDVIEEDGKAFIVMECIAGRTLEEVVRADGPVSDERLLQIADDVLSALEVAHRAGIVHRDVKPANVMITDDERTKLADFGIASVKDDPKITASGLILGSPSYMAPEQATHGRSGPEADLWGLGTTLYFAVEGVPPFEGQGPIPTLTAVVGDEPRPMQRDSELRAVIEALLTKDPEKRPSADEVRRMLRSVNHGTASIATVPVEEEPSTIRLDEPRAKPVTQRGPDRDRATTTDSDRRPWLWLMGLAAAILVAVVAAMFLGDKPENQVADKSGSKQRNEAPGKANNEEAESSEEDSAATVDTESVSVPRGWATYEDPTIGYTISHPKNWSVEVRDEKNTFFRAPNGTFLQIGWRSPPDEAGPVGAWEEYEPSFAARQEGYERIALEEADFKGMDAGWWEMTYNGLHAVNLGFITPDGEYGMALFFNTPEDQWEKSQKLFERLQTAFQPPS